MWKICHGELRNLAYWPAEFGKICRGKLWSLIILLLYLYQILTDLKKPFTGTL